MQNVKYMWAISLHVYVCLVNKFMSAGWFGYLVLKHVWKSTCLSICPAICIHVCLSVFLLTVFYLLEVVKITIKFKHDYKLSYTDL